MGSSIANRIARGGIAMHGVTWVKKMTGKKGPKRLFYQKNRFSPDRKILCLTDSERGKGYDEAKHEKDNEKSPEDYEQSRLE